MVLELIARIFNGSKHLRSKVPAERRGYRQSVEIGERLRGGWKILDRGLEQRLETWWAERRGYRQSVEIGVRLTKPPGQPFEQTLHRNL